MSPRPIAGKTAAESSQYLPITRLLACCCSAGGEQPLEEAMRITGGIAGGRILRVPKGLNVRPTPDIVKQAIFNSLGDRVVGARVLELFAGTGALTLESLSRGAVTGLCIEKSSRHATVLRQNIAAAQLTEHRIEVRVQDVFLSIRQLASTGFQFDLIFADPPYGPKNVGQRSGSFAQQLLDDHRLPSLLAREGLFILGHTKRDTLDISPSWNERKLLQHGDARIRFLERFHDSIPTHRNLIPDQSRPLHPPPKGELV